MSGDISRLPFRRHCLGLNVELPHLSPVREGDGAREHASGREKDFGAAHNAMTKTKEHNMVRVNQTTLITANYDARLISLLRTCKNALEDEKLRRFELERGEYKPKQAKINSAFVVAVIHPEPKKTT